jgi:HSP20 family protein
MEWNIFDEMLRMQEEMDRMFSRFFSSPYQLGPGRAVQNESQAPGLRKALVDVQETEKDVIVTVELPGMEKEDIELTVTSDRVEIKAQKKEETTEEKEGVTAYGSRYAGFYRGIPLSTSVEAEKAKATYKNGVLEVVVPKKEEENSESQNIQID